MKKKYFIFFLFFILSLCVGINFLSVGSADFGQAQALPLSKQLAKIDRNIEYIYLDKEIDVLSLQQKLGIESLEGANNLLSNKTLTPVQVESLCHENDFIVEDKGDYYKVINQYASKTLIADAPLANTYNAKYTFTYEDSVALYFESIEETKDAYSAMKEAGEKVVIDVVCSVYDDFSVQSTNYYTWGYDAMDVATYNNYLSTNNCGKELVVAVLDTGINTSHAILKNRILKDASGKYVGDAIYNSTYTYSGYNFEDDHYQIEIAEEVKESWGHGSHVAGIITQLTPSNVKILPIKIANKYGLMTTQDIIDALQMVIDYIEDGYNVVSVNISAGGECLDEQDRNEIKAKFNEKLEVLRDSYAVSTVAAAGNDEQDCQYTLPASVDDMITVSALMDTAGVYQFDASYSNFGSYIDISAPGSMIVSATNKKNSNGKCENDLVYMWGTSQAAPHVAGALALLCLDKNYYTAGVANYTAEEIESRLFAACKVIDTSHSNWAKYYGHGMVNLKNAVQTNSTISYSAQDTEVFYDGNYHNIKVSVSSPANYSITYSLNGTTYFSDITTNSAFKNFTNGNKKIYYKISATGHTTVIGNANLNIKRRPVTINVKNQTFTYGSVAFDKTKYSITSGSIIASDAGQFILSTTALATSGKGNYKIKMSCSSQNYSLSSNEGTLSIFARSIAIAIGDKTVGYGESISLTDLPYTVTSGSVVGGDDLGLRLSCAATRGSNVGDYDITLSSWTNDNYNITSTSGNLKIERRKISLKLNNQTLEYGDSYSIDDACGSAYSITSGSLYSGDSLGAVIASRTIITGKGEYTLYLQDYSNKNYDVVSATESKLTISPRKLSAIVLDQHFEYGESVAFDQTKYSVSGDVLSGDNLGITLACDTTKIKDAGKYPIAFSYTNKNYDLTVQSGYIVIDPKEITLSAGEYSFTYGEVDLSEVTYSVISGQVLAGDDVAFEIDTAGINNKTPAGNYDLSATSRNKNYIITVENGKVEIKKRDITVASSQIRVYGEANNLDNDFYSLERGEIKNNDDLQIVFGSVASESEGIGSYPLTVESCNKNYNITVEGELQIVPRNLRIVLKRQSSEYGENISLLQNQYYIKTPLPAFENKENLNITLYTTATNASSTGLYEITASCDNANYSFSYEKANYKITPRKLYVKLDDQQVKYSNDIKLNNFAYQLVSGSLLAGDQLDITIYSTSTTFSKSGGSYVLTASIDNENYELVIMTGTLIVDADFTYMIIVLAGSVGAVAVMTMLLCIFGRPRKKKNKFTFD